MNSTINTVRRQMHLVNRLERAGMPLSADVLLESLEMACRSHGFKYADMRKSRMKQLQRDINDVRNLFGINIIKVGQSSYAIGERQDSDVRYERFFADFDLLVALNPDSGISRYVLPERNRNKGSEYLFDILDAIKERSVIEFDYVNYRAGGSVRHHTLAPHFLKEDQGLWYVAGYENGRLLLFGLDRIRDLNVGDEEFEFDEELDIEASFMDSYGIWADPATPTEEIELKYDALDGSFLKARPLHPSQEVIVDNEKEFRIILRLKITNDFVMALLSRARSLEVIRPLHLRERIRETLSAALARNS